MIDAAGGLRPTTGWGCPPLARLSRTRSAAPMHFYCQMAKKGLLKSHTTVMAYRDFNVNPRWIGGYLQQGKLSVEAAHKEFPCRAPVAHGTFWGFLNHMPPAGSPGWWMWWGYPPPPPPHSVPAAVRMCKKGGSCKSASDFSTRPPARPPRLAKLEREAWFLGGLAANGFIRGPI